MGDPANGAGNHGVGGCLLLFVTLLHIHILSYVCTDMHRYIYIYIYIYKLCVCVERMEKEVGGSLAGRMSACPHL